MTELIHEVEHETCPYHLKCLVRRDAITFVCFVALRPNGGTTLFVPMAEPHFFLGKLEQADNQCFVHILLFVTDNKPS